MSTDAMSCNSPVVFAATTTLAQNRETAADKWTALQANQAEALAKRHQAERLAAQTAINAQSQPTGTLINIIA